MHPFDVEFLIESLGQLKYNNENELSCYGTELVLRTMEITQLRAMVERALLDGELSRRERDEIMEAIYSKKQITREECEVMRVLQRKIWTAEIKIED